MNKVSIFSHSKIGLMFLILSISLIFLGCADDDAPAGAPVASATFTLATVPATLPLEDTWIITDGGNIATKGDFDALESLLNSEDAKERKIKLEFPNIELIPSEAFYNSLDEIGVATIISVSAKQATIIESSAFRNSTKLATVEFPEVTNIFASAFSGCTTLASIDFPKVTIIGVSAFSKCTALNIVDFPKVITISANAFSGCKVLGSVTFPVATTIGSFAFSDCTALNTITFPEVTDIEAGAFVGSTALKIVSFPKAVTVGSNAFQNATALQTVELPLVRDIGEYAFLGCKSLITMTIATKSIISILAINAFADTTLATIRVTTGSTENKAKLEAAGITGANITIGQ